MAANETVQPAIKAVRADLYAVDTPLRRTLRRFRRHRLAVLGLGIVLVLIVLAVVGSEAAANKQNLAGANLPPSAAHWLGTDQIGRDVLSRTLVGGRVSLLVGLVSVFFSTSIGIVLGALAGY